MEWSNLRSLGLTGKRFEFQVLQPYSLCFRWQENLTDKLCSLNKQVSVYPCVAQPENPNSYRARRRESFRLQRERRKARKEGNVIQPEPELVLASVNENAENNPIC